MLSGLTLILLCQLLGETIVYLTKMPIPGAVVGMVILLCWLVVRRNIATGLETVSGYLHRYLALLFVPAGVGIINNLDFIRQFWAPFTASIVAGTIVTIAVTGGAMQKLKSFTTKQ